MRPHREFNEELIQELRTQHVFSLYWADELNSMIPEEISLDLQRTDTLPYYKKEITVDLKPITDNEFLRETKACFRLVLTSTCSEFDCERAMNVDTRDDDGKVSAANVWLTLYDSENRNVVEVQKTLWSKEPADVRGKSIYVKLIV